MVAGFRLYNRIFGTYFSGLTGFTYFLLCSYVFNSFTLVSWVAHNDFIFIYLYFQICLVSVVSVVAGFRLYNSIFGTYFSGFTGFTYFLLYSYVYMSFTLVSWVAVNDFISI